MQQTYEQLNELRHLRDNWDEQHTKQWTEEAKSLVLRLLKTGVAPEACSQKAAMNARYSEQKQDRTASDVLADSKPKEHVRRRIPGFSTFLILPDDCDSLGFIGGKVGSFDPEHSSLTLVCPGRQVEIDVPEPLHEIASSLVGQYVDITTSERHTQASQQPRPIAVRIKHARPKLKSYVDDFDATFGCFRDVLQHPWAQEYFRGLRDRS